MRSKELVPGSVQDDDIIILPESPQRPSVKNSIFARKPKDTSFDGHTKKSALKIREQNQTVAPKTTQKESAKKKAPEIKTVNITLSDSDDDFSFRKTTPEKKSHSLSKRPIASDSDDDFSFVEPKRIHLTASESSKAQHSNSLVRKITESLSNTTVSSQLQKVNSSTSKRTSEDPQDDLFGFSSKKSKKNEPKLRRNQKVSESKSTPVSSVVNVASTVSSFSSLQSNDTPLDLTPGREIGSSQWLSKESLYKIKKENPDTEEEQLTSSTLSNEIETKSIITVVPSTSNLNDTMEVRGKTFRKKINFKPQTGVLPTKDYELDDCNLLFPMAT